MRVISQSGEFDFPYEQIVVQRNENIVYARLVADSKARNVLGEYETPEKAVKAMKMLQEEWDDYGACGLFRFPLDSEVAI